MPKKDLFGHWKKAYKPKKGNYHEKTYDLQF